MTKLVKYSIICLLSAHVWMSANLFAQAIELENNFLMNYSFITGTNRGIEQNLDDNLTWMVGQGYTHLRFFGIFPNGVHCFPSPTLDSNGWPRSTYHEQVLAILVSKAEQFGIVVNFDGWEIIAESNYDTTRLGVGYVTPDELGNVVKEVLESGCSFITEEQFGSAYLQEIQSATSLAEATHETTAALWYQSASASSIADVQLANVFCFYPRDLIEADSIIGAGHGYDIPSTVGSVHLFLESPDYFGVPAALAVGSFGTMSPENWKNVLFFAQLEHHPWRVSIEEQDHGFLLDPSFNFMDYVGNELREYDDLSIGERPIVNLVYDIESLYNESFVPTWLASRVNASAIVNTFTSMGYRVIATIDSLLPEASAYYLLLTGGLDASAVAPLPEYVLPLLGGSTPTIIQPTFGIPDNTDDPSWKPLRSHFGLPDEETLSIGDAIPEVVTYEEHEVKWGGIGLNLTPVYENLPNSKIDTAAADIVLSAVIGNEDAAILLRRDNILLINSNLIHHEASFIFSRLLGGPLVIPTGADVVIANGYALIYAEYDSDVEFVLPWSGETQIKGYDASGILTTNAIANLGGAFNATITRGELYVLQEAANDCCNMRGDMDGSGSIDITDLTYYVDFLFGGGPTPLCEAEGDVNGDGNFDITDLTYFVDYLFGGGPIPGGC